MYLSVAFFIEFSQATYMLHECSKTGLRRVMFDTELVQFSGECSMSKCFLHQC